MSLRRCKAALTAARVLLGEQPAKSFAAQAAMRTFSGVQAPAFSGMHTAAPALSRQPYCHLPSLRRWHDASVSSMQPAACMGCSSTTGSAAAALKGSMSAGTRVSAWAASLAAARALAPQRQFSSGAGSSHGIGSGSSGGPPNAANLFPHPTLRKAVKICSACSASASHADSHPHNRPGEPADCLTRYSAAHIMFDMAALTIHIVMPLLAQMRLAPAAMSLHMSHTSNKLRPLSGGFGSKSRRSAVCRLKLKPCVRDHSWRHAQAWSRVGRCSGRTPTGRSCSCSAARTWLAC